MTLKPKEEVGMEAHKLGQFFRVEKEAGEVEADNEHSRRKTTEYRWCVATGKGDNLVRLTTSGIQRVWLRASEQICNEAYVTTVGH